MLQANTRLQNFTLGFSLVAVPACIFFLSVFITDLVRANATKPLFVTVGPDSNVPEAAAKPIAPTPELPLANQLDQSPPVAAEATLPPSLTEQLQQSLPPQALSLFGGIDARVEQLRPQYQMVAEDLDIPWQILPALHLRESGRGLSEQVSLLNGARLGASDAGSAISPFMQSLYTAALRFKNSARSTGHVSIAPEGNTIDELKRAFLIYNRGNALQNPDYSPYVMNYLDSAHVNMVWPPGDPVARIYGNGHRDGNLGALTTYIHYGGPILK